MNEQLPSNQWSVERIRKLVKEMRAERRIVQIAPADALESAANSIEHWYGKYLDVLDKLGEKGSASETPDVIDEWNEAAADCEMRLKPCPFCDSEAKIENAVEVGPNSYVVVCQNPQCMSSSQVRVAPKDDVSRLLIEAWNRRGDKIRAQYAESSENGEVGP